MVPQNQLIPISNSTGANIVPIFKLIKTMNDVRSDGTNFESKALCTLLIAKFTYFFNHTFFTIYHNVLLISYEITLYTLILMV